VQYSICDFLLDIVQNSIEADSSLITLDVLEEENILQICIGDNGKGMDADTLKKIKDPFYTDGEKHKKRKVGLGIPFLMQSVEAVNGEFDIKSIPEEGTSVYFKFDMKNIDSPVLGDLPGTFLSLIIFDKEYDLLIHRRKDNNSYRVSKSELKDALGELNSAESLNLAKKYFASQEKDL
jgi:hypothetical protein